MENFLIPLADLWLRLAPHKVVILGNGPSREKGKKWAKEKALPCISINDIPKDQEVFFAVVTRPQFLQKVEDLNTNDVPIVVPYGFPQSRNSITLNIAEFEYLEGVPFNQPNEVTFREDFVLLTILQILNTLVESDIRELQNMEIDLFGFDFKVSEQIKSGDSQSFLNSLLLRQRTIFDMLLKERNPYTYLSINNLSKTENSLKSTVVGKINKSTPGFTQIELEAAIIKNTKLLEEMFLNAETKEVQIVAEITNNHLGDTKRLEDIVRLCKEQGASVIKIQKRDIDVLYTEEERSSSYSSPFGQTLGDYRAGVELTVDQIRYLTILCAEIEIPWFTSVLDLPSFKLMQQFNLLCVKAPSTISNHRNFLKSLAKSDVEILFISSGATNEDYFSWVTDQFKDKQIVLMQCTSSYPTSSEDCNVAVVKSITNLYSNKQVIPGYSSHDIGSLASQLSVACGARFIEKHIKLGSVEWVHFDGVALDLLSNDLAHFVSDVRLAEKVLGDEKKKQLITEHHKYKPNARHN
jgi:N-acetylneuraminate synthase